MGISGWNELQDNVSLVGTVTRNNYSGHDDVSNPFADWDWSLFVQPAQGFENLAFNRAGVRNDNGIIECEIQPPDGFWDDQTMHRYFDPLIGNTVTVIGTWVEDISHDNKTEIHPITSILDETRNGGGLLNDTEKLITFFVFCDTSTKHFVWRDNLPPHANQLRVGQFRVQFPPPPAPGDPPMFNIWEENDRSLNKNFRITVQGNDAFLEGTVQVDQGHAFYFSRVYMGYRAVKWSEEEDLGGVLTSAAPAACTWGPGHEDIFYRGQNNHLWHRWFDGNWHGEEDLGGILSEAPGACTWGPGRIDIFYRGQNNHLWHRWFPVHP